MVKYAPVVIFVYKRPKHVRDLLNSLSQCFESKFSELIIFSDGPKNADDPNETEAIEEVREICAKEERFYSVKLNAQTKNQGLANSIINGVSTTIEEHGKVIVLEDDLIVSPFFLEYMNKALDLYEKDYSVGCIHGWNYKLNTTGIDHETFFLPGADCWGWATWKRSWDLFEGDGTKLLEKLQNKNLEYSFNRRNTMPFIQMLKDQIAGINDSWAIRWHASLFLKNKFCLHPVNSLVINIGLDGSGTHCDEVELPQQMGDKIKLEKIGVVESEWFYNAFKASQVKPQHFKKPIWRRLFKFLKS
jgi:glycosyltransferase involved in cell wall biosynthesis